MLRVGIWLLVAALCVAGTTLHAGVLIAPREAPPWEVSEWLGGNPGRLADHKGRVVVIEFFQLWCPGCNSFSIPLLKQWDERYGENNDVLIVSIHSVFEGQEFQTPDRLRAFVNEQGFRHVVGIDAYAASGKSTAPLTMDRYGADGTPHLVIIDKEGQIVFSHFGEFDPEPVEAYIDRLARERSKNKPRLAKPATPHFESALAGTYNLQVQEVSRSCGPPEPPRKARVQLKFHPDRIEAKADRPYYGLELLNASYDGVTGKFQADLTQRIQDDGDPVTLHLKVDGHFVPTASPPRLEYEFSFSLLSPRRPERNCDVEGTGSADRVGL